MCTCGVGYFALIRRGLLGFWLCLFDCYVFCVFSCIGLTGLRLFCAFRFIGFVSVFAWGFCL